MTPWKWVLLTWAGGAVAAFSIIVGEMEPRSAESRRLDRSIGQVAVAALFWPIVVVLVGMVAAVHALPRRKGPP